VYLHCVINNAHIAHSTRAGDIQLSLRGIQHGGYKFRCSPAHPLAKAQQFLCVSVRPPTRSISRSPAAFKFGPTAPPLVPGAAGVRGVSRRSSSARFLSISIRRWTFPAPLPDQCTPGFHRKYPTERHWIGTRSVPLSSGLPDPGAPWASCSCKKSSSAALSADLRLRFCRTYSRLTLQFRISTEHCSGTGLLRLRERNA